LRIINQDDCDLRAIPSDKLKTKKQTDENKNFNVRDVDGHFCHSGSPTNRKCPKKIPWQNGPGNESA
jgi:hypothetical protein